MMRSSSIHHIRTYLLWMVFLAAGGYCAVAQGNAASQPPYNQIATPAGAATADASPSFDVVSIKPSNMNTQIVGNFAYWKDTYRAEGWPLESIILGAYLSPTMRRIVRVGGIQPWMQSERFDIVAKVDEDTAVRLQSATNEQIELIVQSMVQKMLADRFGLIAHRAPVEVQGYALTVAKKGSKLTRSQPSDAVPDGFRNTSDGGKARMVGKRGSLPEIDYFHVSTSVLADQLSSMRSMLIVDQTGLKGTYNFSLLPLDESPVAGDESTQSDARLENTIPWDLGRLGLQIKRIKVKTETIVIDSIHRPTPN
jgi:uncharacterized protein (TIGR03435 family)